VFLYWDKFIKMLLAMYLSLLMVLFSESFCKLFNLDNLVYAPLLWLFFVVICGGTVTYGLIFYFPLF
jgi:hypothetical protein